MSNLFKTGIVSGFQKISNEPYVIDVNSRIIRPIEEKMQQEEDEVAVTQNLPSGEELQAMVQQAQGNADSILEDARAKAEEIIENAKLEAEQIKESATQTGYDQGFAQGKAEAMERADIYLANLQKEQEQMRAKQQDEQDKFVHDAELKLVDMSCRMIQKLTGILVDEYKPVLIYLINNALSQDDNSKNLVIKVSEDNYTYVMDNKHRLVGASNPSISMEIYGDTKLNKQQCIIETDNGIIDLSMDVQVNNLITAIKLLSE